MDPQWYRRSYRRMLLDMHIPDWEEGFLRQFDPARMADLYQQAQVASVIVSCHTLTGVCNWPTMTGVMHPGLHGRDLVGAMVNNLRQRGIATVGYYIVVFNNWAFLEHPDWRIVPHYARPPEAWAGGRYGVCCLNHPGYRTFALAQTEELVTGYDFDGFWFDMTSWPAVCCCSHCRRRYYEEEGEEFPRVVDWREPSWCRFQAARERWLLEFMGGLTEKVKQLKPGISVTHNFAWGFLSWAASCPLTSTTHNDFLGGDFYGGAQEQLFVAKTMVNLTQNRPAEFMTSRCINLNDHVRMKTEEELEVQAFAAMLFNSAAFFIDAVDPAGTVNAGVYERIGRIFAKTRRYEPFLGGEPVEDIAVYFSSESRVDFAANGTLLKDATGPGRTYPHQDSVRGVCRVLQEAHLPFGVITRKQLDQLDRYALVILPNVHRMDDEEVHAVLEYVRRGGAVYASGYTSLVHSAGSWGPDFMLADVFGCHFQDTSGATVGYLKPANAEIASVIAPQDYVGISRAVQDVLTGEDTRMEVLMLKEHVEGEVLATLSLPYASPARGSVFQKDWASVHSSPPWLDTAHPSVVRHTYGAGHSIYVSADIETIASEASDHLLLHLIKSLTGSELSYGAEAHPSVWMNVQHLPESHQLTIGFLNRQEKLPVLPISRIPFWLRPPAGWHFKRLFRLPAEDPVDFRTDRDGTLHAEAHNLDVFQMYLAQLSPATS